MARPGAGLGNKGKLSATTLEATLKSSANGVFNRERELHFDGDCTQRLQELRITVLTCRRLHVVQGEAALFKHRCPGFRHGSVAGDKRTPMHDWQHEIV